MPGTEIEAARTGGVQSLADAQLTDEQIDLIKRTIAKGASNDELALFIRQCDRTQLDPFAGQIFCVPRYDSRVSRNVYTTSPSIHGLTLVADRTGEFAGFTSTYWCGADGVWVDVWLDEAAPPVAAKVGVYRRGHAEVHWGVAHYREFVATKKGGEPTQMWREKPAHMTAKCAKALALREAFPHELSGLYTREELHDDIPERSDPNRVTGEPPPSSRRILPPPRRRFAGPEPIAAALATDDGRPVNEDGEIAEAEVIEPDPDSPITHEQMARLVDLFREAGFTAATVKTQFVEDVVGHPVPKASTLTYAEAKGVLAKLEEVIAAEAEAGEVPDAEEPDPLTDDPDPEVPEGDVLGAEPMAMFSDEPFE
jgi:phage recombination protein Bet